MVTMYNTPWTDIQPENLPEKNANLRLARSMR